MAKQTIQRATQLIVPMVASLLAARIPRVSCARLLAMCVVWCPPAPASSGWQHRAVTLRCIRLSLLLPSLLFVHSPPELFPITRRFTTHAQALSGTTTRPHPSHRDAGCGAMLRCPQRASQPKVRSNFQCHSNRRHTLHHVVPGLCIVVPGCHECSRIRSEPSNHHRRPAMFCNISRVRIEVRQFFLLLFLEDILTDGITIIAFLASPSRRDLQDGWAVGVAIYRRRRRRRHPELHTLWCSPPLHRPPRRCHTNTTQPRPHRQPGV